MNLQLTNRNPLSGYPLFNGKDVDLSRQALSQIFNPIFLEPEKGDSAFECSVLDVKLPNFWISSLSYKGNSETGPLNPIDFYALQLIPTERLEFDIDGNRIVGNTKSPLMLSSNQCLRQRTTDNSQCLSLVVRPVPDLYC